MILERSRRIFLTGFSGSGKSAVAALVAAALGWRALDTDDIIEERSGRSWRSSAATTWRRPGATLRRTSRPLAHGDKSEVGGDP